MARATFERLAHATPEQLRSLYAEYIDYERCVLELPFWSRQLRGAALAISKGDCDPQKIQNGERRFDNLP